ncbi:MAG: hypothetical protein NC419_10010 [Muribaculaceae bacterium]|nr:hypothetical protein [Muribaculaceae bacterium]
MNRRIVYQEMKKIVSDKKNVAFVILFVLLQISVFGSAYHKWSDKVGDIGNYNLLADEWNGTIDWSQIDDGIIDSLNHDSSLAMQLLDGDTHSVWEFEYHCAAARNQAWQAQKAGLAIERNDSDKMQYRMLEHVGEPGYANCAGLNAFNQNIPGTVSAVLSSIFIIFVVSPLFTKEKSCHMDAVITASYSGKRKNVFLKMAAVYLCMSIFAVMYYVGFLLLYLAVFGNWKALSMPVNTIATLYMSPYSLSVMEYLVFGLLRFWLGVMTSVTIACALSMNGKKNIGNMIKNFIVLFLPMALPRFGAMAKIGALFPVFAMQGYFSLSQYIDYKIGNIVVPYRWVSIGSMIFINGLLICFMLMRGKENEKRSIPLGNQEIV